MSENEKQDAPVNAPTSEADNQSVDKSSEMKQTGGATPNGNGEKSDHQHSTGLGQEGHKAKEKIEGKKQKAKDKANPAGGYDSTPIPSAQDGYTVRFTFHRATNLPLADLATRSSDPYLTATLTAPGITKRHKEDPDMILRTKTIHRSTEPEWNQEWIVAGIPSSGFRLKCRLYDEDPADHDDRLGNVTITQNSLKNWGGVKEEEFDIKKRMGSKRAYAIRGCAAMFSRGSIKMDGKIVISITVEGPSEKPYGRMYTLGQTMWTKHTSPMIGRLAGTKNLEDSTDGKAKTERYDFQANQFQLQGPVPAELYHRFVEFKPFVKGMFSKTGLRGRVLNRALHHQHARVYNYSSTTKYGVVKPKSDEAALKFLEMAHYDEGGRIYTYVLTLDGLFRFTETGKEFGIDLLSKHTMHSDVNIYITCSGEFFIRRLKHAKKSATDPKQETHPSEDLPGGPPNEKPPHRAEQYELVIDNDSGTDRPNGKLLPKLKEFLNEQFPGLHVVVKECTDKELEKWKKQQRDIKKKQGKNLQVVQDSDGEISSSDEEALDDMGEGKKSRKTKAYNAIEDPKQAMKDLIPGEKGRQEREQRETAEDEAAEAGRS